MFDRYLKMIYKGKQFTLSTSPQTVKLTGLIFCMMFSGDFLFDNLI